MCLFGGTALAIAHVDLTHHRVKGWVDWNGRVFIDASRLRRWQSKRQKRSLLTGFCHWYQFTPGALCTQTALASSNATVRCHYFADRWTKPCVGEMNNKFTSLPNKYWDCRSIFRLQCVNGAEKSSSWAKSDFSFLALPLPPTPWPLCLQKSQWSQGVVLQICPKKMGHPFNNVTSFVVYDGFM